MAGIAGLGWRFHVHTRFISTRWFWHCIVCLLMAGALPSAPMAGAFGNWPVAPPHSLVPEVVAKQGINYPSLGAADHRVLSHGPREFSGSACFLTFSAISLRSSKSYLILKMLGAPATLLGALILESLTKLINVAGAANPGNVGTYEGGNMVIGRLVQLTGTQGLLLALCRRVRAFFWAIIGGICLVWFSKRKRAAGVELKSQIETSTTTMPTEESRPSLSLCQTVYILAHDLPHQRNFEPALAKVATLPVLLRNILGVRSKERVRIIVVVRCGSGRRIRAELSATGRLQGDTEWLEIPVGATLSSVLKTTGLNGGQVAFIMGGSTYRPNLLRMLHEWNGDGGAIEFVSSGKPIGLVALSSEMAAHLAADSGLRLVNEMGLHHWITENVDLHGTGLCPFREVDEESWQAITGRRGLRCSGAKARSLAGEID